MLFGFVILQLYFIHIHHMCSILYMVLPVYIAEISPKKLRGRLVSFNFIALTSGLLVETCNLCYTEMRNLWAKLPFLLSIGGTCGQLGM